jgi:hypothetical protein
MIRPEVLEYMNSKSIRQFEALKASFSKKTDRIIAESNDPVKTRAFFDFLYHGAMTALSSYYNNIAGGKL